MSRPSAQRMADMRLALAFRRPDVEQFADEVPHDQWQEWLAFLAYEPQGWQALNMIGARIAYVTAQCQSRKKLKEADYAIKIGSGHSPLAETARWEAMSVRQSIAAGTFEV